jgi:hypothetical protein
VIVVGRVVAQRAPVAAVLVDLARSLPAIRTPLTDATTA